jgi:hypothetical protein
MSITMNDIRKVESVNCTPKQSLKFILDIFGQHPYERVAEKHGQNWLMTTCTSKIEYVLTASLCFHFGL